MTRTRPPAGPPRAERSEREAALGEALALIGDRWSLLVVDALLAGPRRFNDLALALGGIAPNVLSQRLKQLERDGVLVARPYSQRPLRLAYELTAEGHGLAGALHLLADWAARRQGGEGVRHAACGTPLDARWYCPTCARPVEDPDAPELHLV